MSIASSQRLVDHVDRIAQQHPPIPLDSVDYTVHDPARLRRRYGNVLDYLARVELEVDRNVLELIAMLPDPPEVDRRFYADVWHAQELHHGLILDELQQRVGRPPATTDTEHVSVKIRLLGALAHLPPIHDVVRMLYYLTGMATERSAVLAYNHLHDGLRELGEQAIVATVVEPIRRQEPGHYAYYRMAAQQLHAQLARWQRWLVRRLRAVSFAPVGAGDDEQRADFGGVMVSLGIAEDVEHFAREIGRVEHELLWAGRQGLPVPRYVLTALHEAVELHSARG